MSAATNNKELQSPLFDDRFVPTYDVQSDAEPSILAQEYLDAKAEGRPMTDLLERSVRLTMALRELGKISSILFGLVTAVDTDSGEEIRERYGEGTRALEYNARNKAETTRELTVERYFSRALGYRMLRDIKPEFRLDKTKKELGKRTRYEVEIFKSVFWGPRHAELRDDLRRKMALQITQQKRIRRKNGLGVPSQIDGISIRYSHRLK